MLRILLSLLLCCALAQAGPVAGKGLLTCDPFPGGTRFDLATTPPLHLLVWMTDQIGPHQSVRAWVLNCPPKASCDIVPDAQATIAFDSDDRHGWTGSYAVTRKDGSKQEGRFVATPLKQKPYHGCL